MAKQNGGTGSTYQPKGRPTTLSIDPRLSVPVITDHALAVRVLKMDRGIEDGRHPAFGEHADVRERWRG